jgi:hypothetical protein
MNISCAIVSWLGDQLKAIGHLSADQKIALAGVVITAVAAAVTFLATKYARDAVREGRKALEVARDATREQRSARRFERLQLLVKPLLDLRRAAATLQGKAGLIEPLRDARATLDDLVKPFSPAELPSTFRAIALPEANLNDIVVASDEATKEVAKALVAERAVLAAFATK